MIPEGNFELQVLRKSLRKDKYQGKYTVFLLISKYIRMLKAIIITLCLYVIHKTPFYKGRG